VRNIFDQLQKSSTPGVSRISDRCVPGIDVETTAVDGRIYIERSRLMRFSVGG
jgi:hypothetical protein